MKLYRLVAQYINYRQSLGQKFEGSAKLLRSFCKSVGASINIGSISEDMINKFLSGHSQGITSLWFHKRSCLLGFYRYALARHYVTVVPLPHILPKRPQDAPPYIYSQKELGLIFDAALTYQKAKRQYSSYMVRAILMLTYALGLRIHETLSIALKDIDMDSAVITVRDTKFYKSRLVPFNEQVKEVIAKYLQWRIKQEQPQFENSLLFMCKDGRACKGTEMDRIFRKVLTHAGIKRDGDSRHQPRIHDLRHSFAVHRLTGWYQEKKDVQQLLPILSTYLGHSSIVHTQLYLTMTDELLREASERFEKYAMGEQQ